MIELTAPPGELLAEDVIRQTVTAVLQHQFTRQKVLVLIPDHTRTIPLPQLFRILVESLHDCQQLDFMVALGTHPPLSQAQLCQLVGITAEERQTIYWQIGLLNHAWDSPHAQYAHCPGGGRAGAVGYVHR
jgi:nickel-dependent lactate racemase